MLQNSIKNKIADIARELYNGNTKIAPLLFCNNGIYKMVIDKPAPKHKGDTYCFLEFFEYNKYSKKFEYISAYGDVAPQSLSFELRDRFKLD